MYNSNKSFSTLSLVLVFVLIAFNSAKGIDLPFNPSNYHFLVYDPGTGSNIKEAMNILGISYDLRDKDHPVDANDLQTYAILIVGWNEGASSMGGLDPTTLLNGINGRVRLDRSRFGFSYSSEEFLCPNYV